MNKLKLRILFLAIATLFFTYANAQHNHGGGGGMQESHGMNYSARAPKAVNYALHGGVVNQSGKYKVEMVYNPVLKTDPMSFYLMKNNGKPFSNSNVTGKMESNFQDGHVESSVLEPKGEDGFVVQLNHKTSPFFCLVTFKINGDNFAVRFEANSNTLQNNPGLQTYTCSMHPKIKSFKPGKCPKCGMALIKSNNYSQTNEK